MLKRPGIALCAVLMILSIHRSPAQNYPMKLSNPEKLFGLAKIWMEINENSVVLNSKTALNIDSIFFEYVNYIIKSSNDHEYYKLLKRFAAKLNDSYTFVNFPKYIEDSITAPPIIIKEISGRFYVVNVDKSLEDKLPPGSEITRINGFPVNQFLSANVLPYVSGSSMHLKRVKALEQILDGWINTKVLLNYNTPLGFSDVQFFLRAQPERIRWARDIRNSDVNKNSLEVDWIDRSIALININKFDEDALRRIPINRLNRRADGIIIDIRNVLHDGDIKSAASLLSNFSDVNHIISAEFRSKKSVNLFEKWGEYVAVNEKDWYVRLPDTLYFDPPSDDLIKLPLVILTGNNTAGVAEHFLMMLQQLPDRAIIIGEKTAGSFGHSVPFDLPGKGKGYVGARMDVFQGPVIYFRKGISPDIEVAMDIKSLLNNVDPVLNKALEILKK